jgi:hypothetical protein
MNLEYVPLLRTQRELQGMPRDYGRFRQYLRTIISEDGTGLKLPPLGIMNPMGKDHVTALLDALLTLDADEIAARTVAQAANELSNEPGDFKFALVVADDLKGGWTNRYDYEFNLRFPRGRPGPRPRWLKDFWLTGVLWSCEAASEQIVREAVLTSVYRAAYIQRHGSARTLRDMLLQEGAVMARAGCTQPILDEEDIAYTREVLIPFLDANDKRTVIECLFGDAAGRTLGFTPRGLSHWAGLALALHDARLEAALLSTGSS